MRISICQVCNCVQCMCVCVYIMQMFIYALLCGMVGCEMCVLFYVCTGLCVNCVLVCKGRVLREIVDFY